MKIAIFLHGTAMMHWRALGRSRKERLKEFEGIDQLPDGLAALRDFRGSDAKENIS
jgi:hypothetical protein